MQSDLFREQRTLETFNNHKLDDFMPQVPKRLERDILTTTLNIVKGIERESNAPAHEAEIMRRAHREGINELEASAALERLKQDGQIYDPGRNRRYKIV